MKLFFIFGFFSFATISNANQCDVIDCNQFAAAATAVVEQYFGCLDSDTYNAVYTGHYDACKSL